MTGILDQPVRVDREGERLYFYAPGEVCVDICSGTPEDRKRVMALLEQVQEMAKHLAAIRSTNGYEAQSTSRLADIGETLHRAGVFW